MNYHLRSASLGLPLILMEGREGGGRGTGRGGGRVTTNGRVTHHFIGLCAVSLLYISECIFSRVYILSLSSL